MLKIILVAALSILTVPAFAAVAINAKVSTLGLGLEAVVPLTQTVDGRIGVNAYNYSISQSSTSNGQTTNYFGKLKLGSLEALADWHPFDGSFRLTGGLLYNNNNLSMTAQATGGSVNIGGTSYPANPGDYVDASVKFKKIAPYLGIGWGSVPKDSGFSFTSDIGVLFQGSPTTSVTTNISGATASDISKANSDLSSSVSRFKMYPVVSIGMGYAF